MKLLDKLLGRPPTGPVKPEVHVRRRGQPAPVRPPALPVTARPMSILNEDVVYAVERLHEAVVGEFVAIRELLEDLAQRS
jgi:hypothetical protein